MAKNGGIGYSALARTNIINALRKIEDDGKIYLCTEAEANTHKDKATILKKLKFESLSMGKKNSFLVSGGAKKILMGEETVSGNVGPNKYMALEGMEAKNYKGKQITILSGVHTKGGYDNLIFSTAEHDECMPMENVTVNVGNEMNNSIEEFSGITAENFSEISSLYKSLSPVMKKQLPKFIEGAKIGGDTCLGNEILSTCTPIE